MKTRHRGNKTLGTLRVTGISLVVTGAILPAQHSKFEAAIARFEAQIAADVAKDGIGAISSAVLVGDRVVWSKGFGWADTATHRPADARTIYRVGSISKSITAMLMGCLLQDGAMQLDDPVVKHLPEFAQLAGEASDKNRITLRQLASHTSGLIREPRLRGAASGPIAEWEDKVIASIAATSMRDKPGKSYSYSNIGYGTLGLTLSRIVRKPFMQQVHDRLFAPLKMTSSTFIVSDAEKTRLATGYMVSRRRGSAGTARLVSSELPTREHAGRGYKVPNGGVYSTAPDLCRLITALTGTAPREIFTVRMRKEILRVQTPENPDSGYGLGFSIRKLEGGLRAIGHGGSVAGYNAHLVFDPETGIGVTMLRNYGRGATNLSSAARGLLVALATSKTPAEIGGRRK